MLTADLRSKIDAIWNAFWSGGISNPLEVIEQITYLLFLRRLDDLHTLEENKATRLKKPMERRVFPEGKNPKKRAYDDLRWSRFKHFAPAEMFTVIDEHVFPLPPLTEQRRITFLNCVIHYAATAVALMRSRTPTNSSNHLPELCLRAHQLDEHEVHYFWNVDARIQHVY